jgi:hypothetical protein
VMAIFLASTFAKCRVEAFVFVFIGDGDGDGDGLIVALGEVQRKKCMHRQKEPLCQARQRGSCYTSAITEPMR